MVQFVVYFKMAATSGKSFVSETPFSSDSLIKDNFPKRENCIERNSKSRVTSDEIDIEEKKRYGNSSWPLPIEKSEKERESCHTEETNIIESEVSPNPQTADTNLWSSPENSPVTVYCDSNKEIMKSEGSRMGKSISFESTQVGEGGCVQTDLHHAHYWPDEIREQFEHPVTDMPPQGEEGTHIWKATTSEPDDGCSSTDENFIEAIIHEVRDSLLNFADLDSSRHGDEASSERRNVYCDDEKLSECKERESQKSEPKVGEIIIPHLASDVKDDDDGDQKEEKNFPHPIYEDLVKAIISGDEAPPPVHVAFVEDGASDAICPKDKTECSQSSTPTRETSIEAPQCFNEDVKGDDFFTDIFKDIAESQPSRASGEAAKPDDATASGKSEPTLKSNLKQGKKGKKGRDKEALIDEDVLKQVKKMMETVQSKERCLDKDGNASTADPVTNDFEKGTPKAKEKKKKKKTKRSNSKSEGTSPVSLPEDYSIAQRRILKRGAVWKKKENEDGAFPTSVSDPEGISALAREEEPRNGGSIDLQIALCEVDLKYISKCDSDERDANNHKCVSTSLELNYSDNKTRNGTHKSNLPEDHNISAEEKEMTSLSLSETRGDVTELGTNDSSLQKLDFTNLENPVCELVNTSSENNFERVSSVEASCDVLVLPRQVDILTMVDSETGENLIYSIAHRDERPGNLANEIASPVDESPGEEPPFESHSVCLSEGETENSTIEAFTETRPTDSSTKCIDSYCEKFNSENDSNKDSKSDTDDGSQVYTFNTTVSVIKPLKPNIEFISSNSSPLSSRSSSVDRETVGEQVHIPEESSLKEELSSEDVRLSSLFDNIEASKLDGTNKLQMRNKKRHSLPKSKPPRRRLLASKSFESPSVGSYFRSSQTSLNGKEEIYENAGEILYNETCKCSLNDELLPCEGTSRPNSVPILRTEVTTSPDGKKDENQSAENDLQTKSDSDDSDGTGTWHHKDIKEKIKKIIGSRLQPRPDREFFPDKKDNDARGESPFPRSSSHSATSSKSSSESRDCSRTEPTITPAVHVATDDNNKGCSLPVHLTQDTAVGSDAEAGAEPEEGKYQRKLNLNPKHLSLTYLTDSEVEAAPLSEITNEDNLIMDSLAEEKTDTSLTSIVERWETLQAKAVERQRQSTQLRQLQRQVKSLRLSMEGVLSRCSMFTHPHTLDNASQIGQKVEEVKVLLDETEILRNDLSGLNVMVHRFTFEIGSTFTPLKDEMAELYRLWDETHRRVTGELTRLQSAEATWRLWEEQKAELSQALKQDSDTLKIIDAAIDNGRLTETVTASVHDVAKLLNERRLPTGNKTKSQPSVGDVTGSGAIESKTKLELEGKEDRMSDSGTSGYESCSSDDLSERERRLAYLKRLARDLEASLVPGSKAWNDISATLAEAEKELKGLQDHCRNLLLRTAETLDPSSKQPRFSSNGKRRSWARDGKSCRSPRFERRTRSSGSRREWIWRVVRAALPFQAALLLLFCVACLLEPNCCDSVNTLNFSFTPQLRFVHGSSPV